jgi:hypothetical protein
MPDYQVTVVTGAVRSAGTDASVYLAMHGSMASTGEVLLDNEGRNDFEAGSSDTFTVSADELGRIERITIRHDDKGFASGWFLEFVAIRNEDTGEEWIFPCGRWLDRREGDGKIKLDLTPTASSKTSAAIPAECRATGASSREEAIAWPTILPVVPRAAGNSIKVTLHKTNTPPTGENVSLSVGATLTGQQCAIIQYFAQQREAITSRVTTKRYSGQYGYTGSGNPAKDPVPTELQASTGVDPVHKAVWDEMRH